VIYPSDLSDEQWELIKRELPAAGRGGRPRTTDVRQIINAIFFVSRTGCAWRYLPQGESSRFPPWQTVYHYFRSWTLSGVLRQVHERLARLVRIQAGRAESPSALIVDSQSVKASQGESRGYDGFKKIRGRKRHVLTDTLGLLHSVRVHAADLSDTREGHRLLENLPDRVLTRLEAVYADLGYRGSFEEHVALKTGIRPTLPDPDPNSGQGRRKSYEELREKQQRQKRQAGQGKTRPTKKRWVVERTLAWLNHYRRLSKDYERKTAHSESMIFLAMTQLMLRRLAPSVI
jgi:putative transposase